jgi:signal transduction histidine kinase
LLLLARLTGHLDKKSLQDVPIRTACEQACTVLQDRCTQRGLVIDVQVPQDAMVRGNHDLIQVLCENVLGNAVVYADLDSTITVEFSTTTDSVALRIINNCHNMSPGIYNQAFQPLWRFDHARTDSDRHAGLGLTLVSRIVAVHGGKVVAEVDAEQRWILSITLPST